MVGVHTQVKRHGDPMHVAIIMDGNGRWAQARKLPRSAGHAEGAEAVRRTVIASKKLGVRYLTLLGFSMENWKRPLNEVKYLMQIFRIYLRKDIDKLGTEGVRLRFIGDRSLLDPDIVSLIELSECKTKHNTELDLIVALSYGSRQEITLAAKQLARDVIGGHLAPESIDENTLASRLSTRGIPDPDLIIRTSGEHRISNFLLWQSAYSEFVFTDVFWPDFCGKDLERSIKEFGRRERRYGSTVR